MASKSALDKLQETVVGTVRGVAKDPIGTAKGTIAVGRAVVGQVVEQVTRVVHDRVGGDSPAPAGPTPVPPPARESEPEPARTATPSPADVAKVAKKAPPAKKAAATKAPAKKATPSGKLPTKKAPAKKTAPAPTTAKKTAPAKKAAPRSAPKTAAEVLEDPDLPTPIEALGSSTEPTPIEDRG